MLALAQLSAVCTRQKEAFPRDSDTNLWGIEPLSLAPRCLGNRKLH